MKKTQSSLKIDSKDKVTLNISNTQLKVIKEALDQYIEIGRFSAQGILKNPSVVDALEFASTKYGAYEMGDLTNFGTIISVEIEDGKKWYNVMSEQVDKDGVIVEEYHRTTGEDLIHVKSYPKYYSLVSSITIDFHKIVTKTLHVPDLNNIPVESPLVHEKIKIADNILSDIKEREDFKNKPDKF